jgi:hypothetical protein
MDLVASDALGIPRPHHLDKLVDELALRVDDFKDVIRVAEESLELVVADRDDADVGVLRAAVEEDVLVFGLEAVEESDNLVILGVGEKFASGVGWNERRESARRLLEQQGAFTHCAAPSRVKPCAEAPSDSVHR